MLIVQVATMLNISYSSRRPFSLLYAYTIISNSLAYPTTLLMISFSLSTFSFFASSMIGKYILASFNVHPCSCANAVTAPSESRKRRFFAEVMERDGYDRAAQLAISRRIVLIRI